MKDYLIRGLALNGRVRILACKTTDLVNEAANRHGCYKTAAAALGRTLTVGAMMGMMLKNNEKLTITINGGGPLGTIVVDANAKGEVRGFVSNPKVYLVNDVTKKLDVGRAVGQDGLLTVIKDLGMKEHYSGQVGLRTGEIAEDFAYYFAVSEQTPSIVSLGVLVGKDHQVLTSGGLIIQVLPDASDADIDHLEQIVATLPSMTQLLNDYHDDVEQIIKHYFSDFETLEQHPLTYHCNCSLDRVAASLALLNQDEINDMIMNDHGSEITCQFCGKEYHFSEDDLIKLNESRGKND